MSDIDPFEILQANDVLGDASAPIVPDEQLLNTILSSSRPVRPIRHRKRLILIAAAIVALLLTVAAAQLLTRPVATLAVTCYSDTNLSADRYGAVSNGSPDSSDCESAWETGILSNPAFAPGAVPPLLACVDDLGGLAVFPTSSPDVCKDLGLAERIPDRPSDRLESVAKADAEITFFLDSSKCQSMTDTANFVRRALDDNGLSDWDVVTQPEQEGQPCGSVFYDVPAQTIVIIPNFSAP